MNIKSTVHLFINIRDVIIDKLAENFLYLYFFLKTFDHIQHSNSVHLENK
jgi:hypothetical protein